MKHFLPPLICAFAIFWLSTSGGIQLPETAFSMDKIGNLGGYAVLNCLMVRALWNTGKFSPTNGLGTTTIATLYGAALEAVRWAFFPNRFFEVWDMVANFAGATLGYFAFKFLFTKK